MESEQDSSGDDHSPASGRQIWTFYSHHNYWEGSWRCINGHNIPTEATVLNSGPGGREISVGALGRTLRQLLWCEMSFPLSIATKGVSVVVQSSGVWIRSVGYLWACWISSRCPWPRGFSWADRTLCTFPTTAVCAQAFSILFTNLAKERATAVSGQLLLHLLILNRAPDFSSEVH